MLGRSAPWEATMTKAFLFAFLALAVVANVSFGVDPAAAAGVRMDDNGAP